MEDGRQPEDPAAAVVGLVTAFARELVKEPARVRVHDWTEDGMLHLDLEVAPGDRGRVIGRGGRTADALRVLVETVGDRRGVSCDLEVVD